MTTEMGTKIALEWFLTVWIDADKLRVRVGEP